jgi:tetratricopeptide (TPR) repeat protein
MVTSLERKRAEQLYHSGHSLFEKGLYHEALTELRRAEDAFRSSDAHGYPLTHTLSNGVTGLANTLVVSGFCHQKIGNFKAALTCFETSYINSKFENNKAFSDFTKTFTKDLIACYEQVLRDSGDGMRVLSPVRNSEIDISFQFPYSLPPDVVPFARLYELDPERYERYRDFYSSAMDKDTESRRGSKASDHLSMKRTSIYVWGILFVIWSAYGFIVMEALLNSR